MYKKIMFADNEYEYYSMDQIPQITIEAWTDWARVMKKVVPLVPVSLQYSTNIMSMPSETSE